MSMLAVRVAKRQWATTADPGIFSQIVICLFASGYLRYIVLQYVGPDTWRIEHCLSWPTQQTGKDKGSRFLATKTFQVKKWPGVFPYGYSPESHQ